MCFFHHSETNEQKNPQFHFSNQNLLLSTEFGKINLTIINETNQDQSGSRVGMVDLSKKKMIIFFRETPVDQIFWQQLINIIFTPNWYARLARSSLKLAK